MTLWRPIRGEFERIIANPTPAVLDRAIKTLNDAVAAIRGNLRSLVTTIAQNLLNEFIRQALEPLVDEIIANDLFETFFGPVGEAVEQAEENLGPLRRPHIGPDEQRELVRRLIADPAAIPPRMADALLAEAMTLPLVRLLADLRQLALQAADGRFRIERAAEVIRATLHSMLDAMIEMGSLADAANAARQLLCQQVAGAASMTRLLTVAQFAVKALPPAGRLASLLTGAVSHIDALGLPGFPDNPAVTAVREAAAGLRSAVQRLAAQLVSIERARRGFGEFAGHCQAPNELLVSAAELLRWRRGAVDAAEDCFRQAARVGAAVSVLASAEVASARSALMEIKRSLGQVVVELTAARIIATTQTDWSAINDQITQIAATSTSVAQRVDQARNELSARAVALHATLTTLATNGIGSDAIERAISGIEESARNS